MLEQLDDPYLVSTSDFIQFLPAIKLKKEVFTDLRATCLLAFELVGENISEAVFEDLG